MLDAQYKSRSNKSGNKFATESTEHAELEAVGGIHGL